MTIDSLKKKPFSPGRFSNTSMSFLCTVTLGRPLIAANSCSYFFLVMVTLPASRCSWTNALSMASCSALNLAASLGALGGAAAAFTAASAAFAAAFAASATASASSTSRSWSTPVAIDTSGLIMRGANADRK